MTGLAVEARIAAGPGVRPLAAGGDANRLVAALERETSRGAIAIISFGIAGGLTTLAMPGTYVVADSVVTPEARWPVDASWATVLAQHLPDAVRGDARVREAYLGT